MAATYHKVILSACWIWTLVALGNLYCMAMGLAPGPLKFCWLFAMGCWLLVDVYWAIKATMAKPTPRVRVNWNPKVGLLAVYGCYCLPLSNVPILGQHIMPPLPGIELASGVLCALGVGFAIWARHHLAQNWNATTTTVDRCALVQSGPYAIVRHPIYLGFLMAIIGMILALGELRGFVLLIGLHALLGKMNQEENILRDTFPDEYPSYEQRVRKLLPFIW